MLKVSVECFKYFKFLKYLKNQLRPLCSLLNLGGFIELIGGNCLKKKKAEVKRVKVVKKTHYLNWWYRNGIIGKEFEVLSRSEYDFVKIEYEEGYFGWLPLGVCEINPHLKISRGKE